MSDLKYHKLERILNDAMTQASRGKGQVRHGGDLAFEDQPMQVISGLLDSDRGMAFQAIKKINEGLKLDHTARRNELLGAINYIAGIVLYWDQRHTTELIESIAKTNESREGHRITDVDFDALKYTESHLWTGDDWQSVRRSSLGDWYACETQDASDPGTKFPNQPHIRAIIAQLYPDIPDAGTWAIVRPENVKPPAINDDRWDPWHEYPSIRFIARMSSGDWYGFDEKPISMRRGNWFDPSRSPFETSYKLPKGHTDYWAQKFHDIMPDDDWEQTLICKGDLDKM